MSIKIGVIGSRNFDNDQLLRQILGRIENSWILVSGGAKGVDTLAEAYADEIGLEKIILKPDYKNHGKLGPVIRNTAIVELADRMIVFWDGKRTGTKDVIDKCTIKRKNVEVVRF